MPWNDVPGSRFKSDLAYSTAGNLWGHISHAIELVVKVSQG